MDGRMDFGGNLREPTATIDWPRLPTRSAAIGVQKLVRCRTPAVPGAAAVDQSLDLLQQPPDERGDLIGRESKPVVGRVPVIVKWLSMTYSRFMLPSRHLATLGEILGRTESGRMSAQQIGFQADDYTGLVQRQLRAVGSPEGLSRAGSLVVVVQWFVLEPACFGHLFEHLFAKATDGRRTGRLGQHAEARPLCGSHRAKLGLQLLVKSVHLLSSPLPEETISPCPDHLHGIATAVGIVQFQHRRLGQHARWRRDSADVPDCLRP